jgi:hypothetical protein
VLTTLVLVLLPRGLALLHQLSLPCLECFLHRAAGKLCKRSKLTHVHVLRVQCFTPSLLKMLPLYALMVHNNAAFAMHRADPLQLLKSAVNMRTCPLTYLALRSIISLWCVSARTAAAAAFAASSRSFLAASCASRLSRIASFSACHALQ